MGWMKTFRRRHCRFNAHDSEQVLVLNIYLEQKVLVADPALGDLLAAVVEEKDVRKRNLELLPHIRLGECHEQFANGYQIPADSHSANVLITPGFTDRLCAKLGPVQNLMGGGVVRAQSTKDVTFLACNVIISNFFPVL
jgi:hypothetical protein